MFKVRYFKYFQLSLKSIIFAYLIRITSCQQDVKVATAASGLYLPQLYKHDLGKYKPDYRGQYKHIDVPYNGGYGDRGLPYEHVEPKPTDEEILRNIIKHLQLPQLGYKDHLRVAYDYNYNKSNWEIVHLDWLKEDDVTNGQSAKVSFTNERRLWPTGNARRGQNRFGSNNKNNINIKVNDEKNTATGDITQGNNTRIVNQVVPSNDIAINTTEPGFQYEVQYESQPNITETSVKTEVVYGVAPATDTTDTNLATWHDTTSSLENLDVSNINKQTTPTSNADLELVPQYIVATSDGVVNANNNVEIEKIQLIEKDFK